MYSICYSAILISVLFILQMEKTDAKLLGPDKWVRAFLKQQGLCDAHGQPWSVPAENGLRKENWPVPPLAPLTSMNQPEEGKNHIPLTGCEADHDLLIKVNEGCPVQTRTRAAVVAVASNFNAGNGNNLS